MRQYYVLCIRHIQLRKQDKSNPADGRQLRLMPKKLKLSFKRLILAQQVH